MNSQGHNDTEQNQSLKSMLVPPVSQIVLLFIVSLMLLLILNYSAIWQLITDSSKLSAQTAGQSIQPQLDAVTNFFQKDIFAKATVFIIWACIGCLAYALVGAGLHFIWRVKDDVEGSNYVKPITSKTYWYSRLAQYLYFACITFLTVIFAILFVSKLLPMAVEMTETTIRNYSQLGHYGSLLLATVVTMVCLYVWGLLWRATRYSFQVTFGKVQS